jgi:hypothetical protein
MRILPQASAFSIVALGNLNPLIFRPEWLRDKEIVVGSDFDRISVEIIHPEVVSLKLPWGQLLVERAKFTVSALQEPSIRVQDLFVKCFQVLPETPISAVGLNREVHFPTHSESARNRVGDTLAPKEFWGDFVTRDGARAGGVRSIIMEQSIPVDGRLTRIDGLTGWIQVRVEPSLHAELRDRHGIFVAVNDHYDLMKDNRASDGRAAAGLAEAKWERSLKQSEHLIDRIMELADARLRDWAILSRRTRCPLTVTQLAEPSMDRGK